MLFQALRASRMLAAQKTTTGIVGLEAREALISISKKLLRDVQVIPATAQYRQAVEKTYAHRLDVCSKHTEVEEIESVIGQGQIEELLRMARDEERLIPKMAEWKPWDVPDDYKVTMTEYKDNLPKPKA